MNGIEKITGRLDAAAAAQADSIIKEAKARARETVDRTQADIAKQRAELIARGDKEAAEREERLVSVAQMEARQIILSAKQEMMEQAFDGALKKLCALSDEEYAAFCAELLKKAAPDGKGDVFFPADRKKAGSRAVSLVNRALNGNLVFSGESRPIKGGFLLKNGSVEVNCSFETLVRLQRSEAAGEVAALLFPKG